MWSGRSSFRKIAGGDEGEGGPAGNDADKMRSDIEIEGQRQERA